MVPQVRTEIETDTWSYKDTTYNGNAFSIETAPPYIGLVSNFWGAVQSPFILAVDKWGNFALLHK